MVLWSLKDCSKCNGDLVLDEDLWRCFQCGHYYYPNVLQPVEHLPEPNLPSPQGNGQRRRAPCGGIAGRNINSLIRSNTISEERWWAHNREIIIYLDKGRPVTEIATLTARGQRKVRAIKERLAEFRSSVMAKKVLVVDDH